MSLILREFESYSAFLDKAENGLSHLKDEERSSREISKRNDTFFKTESFTEAIGLARAGWSQGLEKLSKMSARICNKVYSSMLKDSIEYDTTGLYVDVGTYLSGQPECMANIVQTEIMGAGNKIVKMVCSTGALGDVSADTIFLRGSAICSLIDCLEKSGKSVELTMFSTVNTTSGAQHEFRILAKRAGEPLEMDRLAFALCNASMHRRIGWSVKEQEDKKVTDRFEFYRHGGYSCSCDTTLDRGDIYTGFLTGRENQWSTEENAFKWVLTQLKAQGVEFETV